MGWKEKKKKEKRKKTKLLCCCFLSVSLSLSLSFFLFFFSTATLFSGLEAATQLSHGYLMPQSLGIMIIICLHFQRRLAASINEGARPARAALVAALNEIIFPVPLFLVTLHDLRTPSPVRHFRLSFVVSSPCSNNRPSPGESTLRKGSDCSPGPAEGLCVGTINRHP